MRSRAARNMAVIISSYMAEINNLKHQIKAKVGLYGNQNNCIARPIENSSPLNCTKPCQMSYILGGDRNSPLMFFVFIMRKFTNYTVLLSMVSEHLAGLSKNINNFY